MTIELGEMEVRVGNLEIGMRVTRLDRPWEDTEFLLQGFIIQDQEEIFALRRQCDFVFVETRTGVTAAELSHQKSGRRTVAQGLSARGSKAQANAPNKSSPRDRRGIPKKRVSYINTVAFDRELPKARDSYQSAKDTVKSIMAGIRIGRTIDINESRKIVDNIVDSILRNADALMWLTKLKEKDDYTAEHSLNVCILSIAFARHLGHNEADIRKIGLCGFLHDVGKFKIPTEVLNKPGRFTDAEYVMMKKHTVFGRNLLMSLKKSDHAAIDVAFSHHERIDGSGYPRGVTGENIPYYAKIIALTDTYDAITSSRCYDQGRPSMEALDIIYKCRGKQFDEELAVEFIRCIGIYPPGSIVLLNTGEVGIVLSSNPANKLRPKILLVLNAKKELQQERILDLQPSLTCEESGSLHISCELPNGKYGVDIREYTKRGLVLGKQSVAEVQQ